MVRVVHVHRTDARDSSTSLCAISGGTGAVQAVHAYQELRVRLPQPEHRCLPFLPGFYSPVSVSLNQTILHLKHQFFT